MSTTPRDTDYAKDLGYESTPYGDEEIRLERLLVYGTGDVEIRLSWWKGGKYQRAAADLPVADFLDLVKRATLKGLLTAPTDAEPG